VGSTAGDGGSILVAAQGNLTVNNGGLSVALEGNDGNGGTIILIAGQALFEQNNSVSTVTNPGGGNITFASGVNLSVSGGGGSGTGTGNGGSIYIAAGVALSPDTVPYETITANNLSANGGTAGGDGGTISVINNGSGGTIALNGGTISANSPAGANGGR
jgi:hypothetical protein